jgi:hypothetical protein
MPEFSELMASTIRQSVNEAVPASISSTIPSLTASARRIEGTACDDDGRRGDGS